MLQSLLRARQYVLSAGANPVLLGLLVLIARQDYIISRLVPHSSTTTSLRVLALASVVWVVRNFVLIAMVLRRGRIGLLLPPISLLLYMYNLRAPELRFCRGSNCERRLADCPALGRVFVPFPLWSYGWWGGLMHTALGGVIRGCRASWNFAKAWHPPEAVQPVATPDGGTLRLEWFHPEQPAPPETPIVVIFPGNVGGCGPKQGAGGEGSAPWYMAGLIKLLTSALPEADRMRCCVYVRRGCGENKLSSPRVQSYIGVQDSELALRTVCERYPTAPLLAVGFSLGGMILTNFLGHRAGSTPSQLLGACCCGNPFSAVATSLYLQNQARLLDGILRRSMVDTVLLPNKQLLREQAAIDVEQLLPAQRSFRQIYANVDLHLQAEPSWTDLDDYLLAASPNRADVLGKVAVPTLFFYGENDPIVDANHVAEAHHHFGQPKESFIEMPEHRLFVDQRPSSRQTRAQPNPNIALASHHTGGHHTFLGPAVWQPSYLDKVVVEWLQACIKHRYST